MARAPEPIRAGVPRPRHAPRRPVLVPRQHAGAAWNHTPVVQLVVRVLVRIQVVLRKSRGIDGLAAAGDWRAVPLGSGEERVRLGKNRVLLKRLGAAGADTWAVSNASCIPDAPSGHSVLALPSRVAETVRMRVGLARRRVSRPRTIAGGPSWVCCGRPRKSVPVDGPLRKMTGSVSRIWRGALDCLTMVGRVWEPHGCDG